jgi:hypothetical protein
LKNRVTTLSASGLVRSVVSFNAWIRSSLFMRPVPLLFAWRGEKRENHGQGKPEMKIMSRNWWVDLELNSHWRLLPLQAPRSARI